MLACLVSGLPILAEDRTKMPAFDPYVLLLGSMIDLWCRIWDGVLGKPVNKGAVESQFRANSRFATTVNILTNSFPVSMQTCSDLDE